MEFDRNKFASLDLETTGDEPAFGLQPWRVAQGRATIRCMSVAHYDEQGKMSVLGELDPDADQIVEWLRWVAQTNRTVIAWNAPFDISWLLAYGLADEVNAVRWWDGMLIWKHATCEPEYDIKGEKRKGYRLEDAVKEFYPQHAAFKGITNFHSTDPEELKALMVRNKMDAALTLRLAEQFFNMLNEQQQKAMTVEAASLVPVARANLTGLYANPERIAEQSVKLINTAEENLAKLREYGATPEILGSPSQLASLMYDAWGLPILKRTTTGKPSTDQETLFELAPSDERAQMIRDYREAGNLNTKFVGNIADSLAYNGDGYTRPAAKVYGTYSGRMTYSSKQGKGKTEVQTGFALHQMKNDRDIRSIIEPPPGYDIVEFDAANQEFRLMAILSGDETMLRLCMPGQDPHGYMGSQISRVNYDWLREANTDESHPEHKLAKQYRKVGKFANLAFQYRVGAKKATVTARVKHGLDVQEPFVKGVQRTYLNTYKKMKPYWSNSIRRCQLKGYAETLAGRRVQLKQNWNGPLGWSLESTSINFPIQGSGADQKYLAIACLKPALTKYGGFFYFELHDGIFFILPKDKSAHAVQEMKAVLNNLPYKKAWNFVSPIPLPWDCKIGSSWGNMKEVK
jgi:DNA polymerase-1